MGFMRRPGPTSEVVKSTPVGVAAINNAPKISDFKEGTTEERIRAHAAAMVKWSTPNLTRRAIEKETRVRRRGSSSEHQGMEIHLPQSHVMLAYTQDKYWGCVGLFNDWAVRSE